MDEAVPHKIVIRNSDRATYRRCRRKWDFQSALRQNLIPLGAQRAPLWFGSGFHFALEDYHGYNKFGDPRRAFDAYVAAADLSTMPDAKDFLVLADGMLTYYVDIWLPRRPGYETLWVDGQPQVEVNVEIDVTDKVWNYLVEQRGVEYATAWWERVRESRCPGRNFIIVIGNTFDRVLVDDHDRIWGEDYKTAKIFSPRGDLEMNSQAGQYYWAMVEFYGPRAEGIMWQQHLKTPPEAPEELKSGGFSLNKGQKTTYALYRRALLEKYGQIPKGYIEILNHLSTQEDEDGDKYIRRDYIHRNLSHREAEERKIVAEVHEMLDPDIPIYPNPTRDCNWDCPFRDISIAMDDGSDWQWMMNSEFVSHVGYDDSWRGRVIWPSEEATT